MVKIGYSPTCNHFACTYNIPTPVGGSSGGWKGTGCVRRARHHPRSLGCTREVGCRRM